jgi:hypothetical protein
VALTLRNPVFQFVDSTGTPYAGGSLTFYESGSSTPLDTYNDPDLLAPHLNSNPVTLNSAGWPDVNIFLTNVLYRVVLKDSSGNTIWTRDDVSNTDLASVMILKVGSGDPNGSVAGTAGSSGVLPTGYWDYTNAIEYRCTTTGAAAAAVWTALNASSAIPVVTAPQGYLTPTSGTPVITTEVLAGTSLVYTPYIGNLVPIYNGSSMIPTTFTELTLTLAAQHLASQIYDVFVFSNAGVPTLATGPAWTTPTAGSGARGTGAGTTELTRLSGYWVNAVQITARNGATTYTIAANRATYLGSIFMDGTNGQLTCHRSWGASRKWGIWNAYNRQPLHLKAGDSTASWTYNTATIRASRDQATNSLTVFQGLPEEVYELRFVQRFSIESDGAALGQIGVGFNSTTVMSGRRASINHTSDSNGGNMTVGASVPAQYLQVPSLGINTVTALEVATTVADGGGTMTWFGGEDDMVLSAYWRG